MTTFLFAIGLLAYSAFILAVGTAFGLLIARTRGTVLPEPDAPPAVEDESNPHTEIVIIGLEGPKKDCYAEILWLDAGERFTTSLPWAHTRSAFRTRHQAEEAGLTYDDSIPVRVSPNHIDFK